MLEEIIGKYTICNIFRCRYEELLSTTYNRIPELPPLFETTLFQQQVCETVVFPDSEILACAIWADQCSSKKQAIIGLPTSN